LLLIAHAPLEHLTIKFKSAITKVAVPFVAFGTLELVKIQQISEIATPPYLLVSLTK